MELKELEKILKLCRKQGVTEITCEGLSVKFGDMPRKDSPQEDVDDGVDGLTEEQLMFAHIVEGR